MRRGGSWDGTVVPASSPPISATTSSNPPLPQVQIQQIVQNPPPLPPPHYPPPRQRIVSYQPAAGAGSQMGGQGGFSTPEGGGGWSWYVNGPSPAFPGVVRQYTYPRGRKFISPFIVIYYQRSVHKDTIQGSSYQSNINVQVFSYKSRPVLNNQVSLFPPKPADSPLNSLHSHTSFQPTVYLQ